MQDRLKVFLDAKVAQYNQPFFIKDDPISVPHQYTQIQDIEIAGFFAAIFAWGNRTTIINKANELLQLMDNAPYQFCTQHQEADLKPFLQFKHRTFNATDLLFLVAFFKRHYTNHASLETAFSQWMQPADNTIEQALNGFYKYVFDENLDYPERTKKHIAAPFKHSTCKRLCMYLRWMVRKDVSCIDFGIWQKIDASQLICPVDLHVSKVAHKLHLIKRNVLDWDAALELTAYLKTLDEKDPVKYDFALFGLGVFEKFY